MDREEFLQYIDPLAQVAVASDDEIVRRLGAALLTMKASILADGPILESFLDQMQVMNINLRATVQDLMGGQ